jgi:glycosyltransferase involved in cell wall biosynthesis
MSARILVIDNDPDGNLRPIIESLTGNKLPILLLSEAAPGKSTALNAAIAVSDADYVGLVDDDEELTPDWFNIVFRAIGDGGWDFLGGPCLPRWPFPPPEWLPDGCSGVLGIVDSGPDVRPFGPDFPGILSGGNAVVRLPLLRRIGGFSTALGPRMSHRFLSGEDEEMYLRLLEAGARGIYIPELAVHHHVHPHRLAKPYYRRWIFWNGTAKAMVARRHQQPVPYLLGVPRYVFGRALRGLVSLFGPPFTSRGRFGNELSIWHLAGFLYGRHFYSGRNDGLSRPADAPMPARDLALLR